MKISKELSAVCNLCYSVTWLISERHVRQKGGTVHCIWYLWPSWEQLVRVLHFAAFNPVEKERSEAPAIWQMSLKYPTVLYQRMKSESFLILSEDRDIVQIQHTIGHFTPSKSLFVAIINSHRVVCSIQTILTFLCLMVWIIDAFNLVFSPVYHTSLCSIQASSCGVNFLSKF